MPSWKQRSMYTEPGQLEITWPDGHTASVSCDTFGKANQPRDYHGRWGEGGSNAAPLKSADAYRYINERQKRITKDTEKYGLGQYVNGRAEIMNHTLREGKGTVPKDSDHKTAIDRTEAAIKNNAVKLDQPIIVYRGVNKVEKAFGTTDVKKLVGAEITDHGFMSSTTNPRVGTAFRGPGGGAVVNITVPKGHQILGVDKARGGSSLEQEMLLQRGTTIRVMDATKTGTQWTIDAEVV